MDTTFPIETSVYDDGTESARNSDFKIPPTIQSSVSIPEDHKHQRQRKQSRIGQRIMRSIFRPISNVSTPGSSSDQLSYYHMNDSIRMPSIATDENPSIDGSVAGGFSWRSLLMQSSDSCSISSAPETRAHISVPMYRQSPPDSRLITHESPFGSVRHHARYRVAETGGYLPFYAASLSSSPRKSRKGESSLKVRKGSASVRHMVRQSITSGDAPETSYRPPVSSLIPQKQHRNDMGSRRSFPAAFQGNHANLLHSMIRETPTVVQRLPVFNIPHFDQQFEITGVLGEGGYGTVYSCIQKSTKQVIAVKRIRKDKLRTDTFRKDSQSSLMLPNEIAVLKSIQHPRIIEMLDFFEDSKFFYLVTPLHGRLWASPRDMDKPSAMDLFECIRFHRRLDQQISRNIFVQIVDSLHFLHVHCGLCHGDIKDENVLIDEQYRIKLIDFGSTCDIYTTGGKMQTYTHFLGTLQYCPPEIMRGESFTAPSTEIWALGILLYTMITGEYPCFSPSNIASQQLIIEYSSLPKRAQFYDNMLAGLVSEACKNLLLQILDFEPRNRPSIAQIAAHPWLTETSH
eukprot:Partr_v1_DN27537_c2_g1_i3_m30654 putative PAS domain containing serine threonine kinase